MRAQDLALQRDKYKHLSNEEWRWFLQQVEGRERTADKLPTFAAMEDWWYPVRLSCEQCSSELTAKYKVQIVTKQFPISNGRFLDLTGGYGVDTYFLSEVFAHTDYVEQNAELCRIAEHNIAIANKLSAVSVHNSTAEKFLPAAGMYDLIYLDPYRRDSHGGKVFRLEDCTPNIVELLPTLLQHLTPSGRILLKLSPMLDITQALKELLTNACRWSVFVVAVKNEVKEVLLLSGGAETMTAIDLAKKEQAFVFTKEEEQRCSLVNGDCLWENGDFLYEPNAAILKAGAYKLVAQRFGLRKLDVNTHLYVSDKQVDNFPGRVWTIQGSISSSKCQVKQANVLTRNYPLTPEQLKKKLHLRDGGTTFVIGCRINGKPSLLLCNKVSDHTENKVACGLGICNGHGGGASDAPSE